MRGTRPLPRKTFEYVSILAGEALFFTWQRLYELSDVFV